MGHPEARAALRRQLAHLERMERSDEVYRELLAECQERYDAGWRP